MMRTIGYNRIISLDSFKKPNFELLAEILDWLASRFDPNAEIPSELETDKDRVNFMKAVCGLFTTKARIKISPINLYYADFHAVPELIKIASLLHNVYTTQGTDAQYSSNHILKAVIIFTK
jgi:clusterin-associated protein 1